MPRAPKQVDKTDPEYLEKRKRNNEAIKKSREKAKARAEKTQRSIELLRKSFKKQYEMVEILHISVEKASTNVHLFIH